MRFENDAYLRKLAIHDHLRECLCLYDRYKMKEAAWDDVRRELMDLYILLWFEVGKDRELFTARLARFKEKEKGGV